MKSNSFKLYQMVKKFTMSKSADETIMSRFEKWQGKMVPGILIVENNDGSLQKWIEGRKVK